jgi:Flp pilus assembly protein TadD
VGTIPGDEFCCAVRLHQAGEPAAATCLYASIPDRDGSNADALHVLGVLRHQQGQSRLAADLIGSAVALRPGAAIFRATLGTAFRALGHFDRAAGCSPGWPEPGTTRRGPCSSSACRVPAPP